MMADRVTVDATERQQEEKRRGKILELDRIIV